MVADVGAHSKEKDVSGHGWVCDYQCGSSD